MSSSYDRPPTDPSIVINVPKPTGDLHRKRNGTSLAVMGGTVALIAGVLALLSTYVFATKSDLATQEKEQTKEVQLAIGAGGRWQTPESPQLQSKDWDEQISTYKSARKVGKGLKANESR